MASQVRFVIANTAEELTRTVNELLKDSRVKLAGFTRDPQTGRYECLVHYLNGSISSEDAVLQQLSPAEQREYDQNTARALLGGYNGRPDKWGQVAKDMGFSVDELDDLLRGSA